MISPGLIFCINKYVCFYHEKHCFKPCLWYIISVHLVCWFMTESLFKEFMRLRKIINVSIFLCICAQFQIWQLFDSLLRRYQSECEYKFHLCNSAGYAIFILYFILPFLAHYCVHCSSGFYFKWENFWNLWQKITLFVWKGAVFYLGIA